MRTITTMARITWFGIVVLAAIPSVARAQQAKVAPRITEAINESNRVVLHGNTHPLARAEFDRGAAPASLPLQRMLLVLQRSPEQQAALAALLARQQNPASPDYHRWLTPQQFGQQFGPADEDVQAITLWLQSQGFEMNRISNGRVFIEFSGTAGQLRETFRAEIRKYAVNGIEHWANSSDPQIPAALAPVIAGIATLHDFEKKPQLSFSGETIAARYQTDSFPQLTFMNGRHGLSPGDFGVIYNVNPILATLVNGSGQSIAVVARTNFNVQDVAQFRNLFNLSGGSLEVILNGADPGDLGGAEETEAVLDATWAGAIARGADIKMVVSASTHSSDGADLSEAFIIDNNLAEIMTESFGTCEAGTSTAEASAKSALAEQAAAEGITYFVSAGDDGAEGCDDFVTETVAHGPVSVNLLASSPFTVAVGGTQFDENGNDSRYWNPSTVMATTALSYIPEDVWNQSCVAGSCASGLGPNIIAGSGGSSTLYSKPPWQMGVPGIPPGNSRYLPDVSLTASGVHDGYLLCLRQSCVPNAQGLVTLFFVGGTSASSPAFASIMALVDQRTNSRQGQANDVLYRLAAQEMLGQCNGSSQTGLPAANCIFNDVTVGNNAVPGEAGYGTPNASYQSGVGYDLATGLGSVNVTNLVLGWGNTGTQATKIAAFTLAPITGIQHGVTPVNYQVTVAPASGMGTPSGDVAFLAQAAGGGQLPITFVTLTNSSASGMTQQLPGGTYNVSAHYDGDGTFLPSDSMPVQVTVTPEPSSTTASAFQGSFVNPTPVSSVPYGSSFSLMATVTGQTGIGAPTGTVGFLIDGSYASGSFPSLSSVGQAVLPQGAFPLPAAGQHTLTAQYSGDASFNASNSAPAVVTIAPASTQTALTSGTPATVTGQPVTLTATVTASGRGAPPSGSIVFLAGSAPVGTALLSGNPNGVGTVSSTATLTTSQLPTGSDSITAQYNGDPNYTSSTSTVVPVAVSGTFVISASPANITVISPGMSGTTTLTFQAAAGFTGSAMLAASACSNLPLETVCSFNPPTVNFTPTTTSVPVIMTVNTSAPGTAAAVPRGLAPFDAMRFAAPAAAFAALFLVLLLSGARRRSAVLAALTLALVASAISCGGGGGSTVTRPPPNPGTTPGLYMGVTVTVTINGATQSINNLIISVGF